MRTAKFLCIPIHNYVIPYNLSRLIELFMTQSFDVAVVGGGINGCGLAADAALRGLSVILIEQGDIASKTSSSSSKLIHGGLRYLEYYDFALVKKALIEREILLSVAPHLIRPQAFILPHQAHVRSAIWLRMGLFLYDRLHSSNSLPLSHLVKRRSAANYFNPLCDTINKGFVFYDCKTDDARLTLANALQARAHGAVISLHSELIQAEAVDSHWQISIRTPNGTCQPLKARVLINAAGPWVNEVNHRINNPPDYALSLIKGSHLVVKAIYSGEQAYLLQHEDKRVVFVIPYHGYTLIGTTDVPYTNSLENIQISQEETLYLLNTVNQFFKINYQQADIIQSWSGVRPLLASDHTKPQALSRDYQFSFKKSPAPLISIYGGKLTTYRQLAEEAIDKLKEIFPNLSPSTTRKQPLPGAENFHSYQIDARQHYSWMDPILLKRFLSSYGSRCDILLQNCHQLPDLGKAFGHGLYEREINYLLEYEWAKSAEDILWRRTKLGLFFEENERIALENYLSSG